MTCERVCVLVDVDGGNDEGVCDDVLDMEKIVTVVVTVETLVSCNIC
jgi:hypothetical protein